MTDLHRHDQPSSYQPPLSWPDPPASSRPGGSHGAVEAPVTPTTAGRQGGWRNAAVSAVVAAVVAAGVAVPVTMAVTEADSGTVAAPAAQDVAATASAPDGSVLSVADVADAVAPSVARVDVAVPGGQASGSAVVYREDGYLLTNAHVVANATEVGVTLPEGSRLAAEVVGADVQSDLAVLRIDVADVAGGTLPAAAIAEGTPRVGETAVAIGSPFELDGSVTSGIVSGLGRSIPGTPLADLIQTDAPINPGNSGGALVNDRAEVIGINTAILPGSPTGRGNIGIGFAIPITTATHLADQLIDDGFVRHAQLGVQGQDVDPRVAQLYGLEVDEGALIVEVAPDTAAAEAGLVQGDIVTAIDGEPIAGMAELAAEIRRRSPGDEVTLTVSGRSGEREVTVILGEAARQR
jgi:S1-C subfamily serine protease